MDLEARQLERSGDSVGALKLHMRTVGNTRMPWDCPWCKRCVDQVEVACGGWPDRTDCGRINPPEERCGCNGTGRVPWPWESRLQLAAYAGDEAARMLVPDVPGLPDHKCLKDRDGKCFGEFANWIEGLTRWPNAQLIAAIACGWAVLRKRRATPGCALDRAHDGDCLECLVAEETDREIERALTAASDHATCGCEASRAAWAVAWAAADTPHLPWLAAPHAHRTSCIQAAAEILTEPVAREVISEAPVRWAYYGEVPR